MCCTSHDNLSPFSKGRRLGLIGKENKKRGVQKTLYAAVLVTDRLRPERDLHNNRADNCPSNYPQDRMTTAFFRRPFLRSFVSSCSLLAIFGGSSTAITRLVAATTRSGLLRIFSFHCFPPLRYYYVTLFVTLYIKL